MKIELKNVKFSEAMSEETNAFTADLYINGVKVGYCKNQGCGGCTDYHTYSPEFRPVIAEAESYCKALPDINYGGTFSIKNNLEHVIDQLFEDWLKAKDKKKADKKMEKLYNTAVVFGKPNADNKKYYNYKRPLSEVPILNLKILVARILNTELSEGEEILNTNFKIVEGEIIFT